MSETQEPIVFVVDDDADYREALHDVIQTLGLKVMDFDSGQAFLEAYEPGSPSCLVSDVCMPEMSGLELLEELNRRSIDLPAIMITAYGDIQMSVNAMKVGAVDFVEKPCKAEYLLELVQKAVGQSAKRRSETETEQRIRQQLAHLTPRERQILDLIVDGEPNKRIAHFLGLSKKTIEYHRTKIMRKLEARSLADLVRKVILVSLN